MDMNQAYTTEMGRSLLEAADTDPTEVYRYIRRAIGQSAAQNTACFAYDNAVVSMTTNGVEATRSLAEETILAIMPPEYEGPRTVRVGLEPIVEGDDPALPIEPIQLLELKVIPPDLAA